MNYLAIFASMAASVVAAAPASKQTPKVELFSLGANIPGRNLLREVQPLTDSSGWIILDPKASRAIKARKHVVADVLVRVDASGSLVACETIKPEIANFSELVCNAIRERGEFLPAIDDTGKRYGGDIIMRAKYERPAGNRPPPPLLILPGQGRVTLSPSARVLHGVKPAEFPRGKVRMFIITDRFGHVKSCRITESSGGDIGDIAACAQMRATMFDMGGSRGGAVLSVELTLPTSGTEQ